MCEAKQNSKNRKDKCVRSDIQDCRKAVFMNFWEIEHFFKCPVIGMCLTFSEQKQLLKKAGFSIKKKTPFEIHEMLVANSEHENQLARKVDNLLNRKFGAEAASLLALGKEKFIARWRAVFDSEDCRCALWAAAAGRRLSLECRSEVFGDVHMTMHWSANQSIKLKQKLAAQQAQIDGMQQAGKEAAALQRNLRKENNRLRKSEADLKTRLTSMESNQRKLEERLAAVHSQPWLHSLEQKNQRLQDDLNAATFNLKTGELQVAKLKEQNAFLSEELEQHKELARHLSQEIRFFISNACEMKPCEESCSTFDLCQKRVLIVGGLTRMEALYRRLIEGSGGKFEYHDGYMKKGTKSLENRLRRADMVLCPVSCNSHAACSMVKNLAKKHNKPLHMLANSSLSTVSQVIRGTASEHAVVN